MRRRSDRIEGWLTTSVLLIFLAAAPVAGGVAGRATYRADVREQRWNQTHFFPVESTLLADATQPFTGSNGVLVDVEIAPASWTSADGVARQGIVVAEAGDKAGRRVVVWTDDRGEPTAAPTTPDARGDAIVAATLAVLGVATVLIVLTFVTRALLNRHRLRSWQHEWLEVGPRWTRHR
jgi:hypothetical protein